jgi:hypothetical protein
MRGLAQAPPKNRFMEAQSTPPREGEAGDPKVGQFVMYHVPGLPAPIDAIVTEVALHEARPPSLGLRIQFSGTGPTTLFCVEHISQGHPLGGWELRK